MRPIQKPPPPAEIWRYPASDLLLDAIGSYCSTCERRLVDWAWPWDAQRRVGLTGKTSVDVWPGLLLLCGNCRDAAAAPPPTPGPLLLPDRDLTFMVSGDSPFVYGLQPVQRIFLDEDGVPEGAPETIDGVIVEGTTSVARETIDYFALNTPYYDATTNTLRIPTLDYESLRDRRIDARTEAWNDALRAARDLRAVDAPATRQALVALIRHTIEGAGCWSTWATVLWSELQDRSLLATMLMPPEPAGLTAGQESFGGTARRFASTRSDWLT
jgi:hypothetical protein